MTIYSIAERSKYSIATVSRVLNGSEKVSEKARKKIQSVIAEENYTPNAFARGLGLNTMKMVGILCTDVADLYYAKAVSLLHKYLKKQGFEILLSCTGDKLEDKKKALNMLMAKRVDAVILVGSALQEKSSNEHIRKAAQQLPVVIVNGYIDLPGVICVLCDEKQAMCQNVQLLHEQGCRRILYLYDTCTYSGMQKLDGYTAGCEQCGIDYAKEMVCQVSGKLEDVRKTVGRLLETGFTFDAVMASEDTIAIGAQKAMSDFNVSVPIIGFNNSVLAECATFSLSSVDNMLDTLCKTAIHCLTGTMRGEAVPGKVIVSGVLVERETFRCR